VRTEDLIHELAKDAPPVRRLQPLSVRLFGWVALAALSLGVVTMWMGARRDLAEALQHSAFQFEAAMLILTAMSAAVGALTVSIPGRERSALIRWLPIVGGAICILWVGSELVFASMTGAPTGRLTFAWRCVYKTASVALVPGIALFALVRRAAPLRAAWAGLLAILATASVGVLGANVICPIDRPLHLLLWHVAPLMLFAAIGAGLGTWLIRWNQDLRVE
jgi:hypothetical protein